MKVVILAGGFGTRLSEYTGTIPKPMVEVGGRPVLWHIMNLYAHYGYNDFVLALGYKAEVIKEYFLNYHALNSDFTIDLSTGEKQYRSRSTTDWKVTLVDTGLNTLTGGRVGRLRDLLKDAPFMLTYGDGVCDVNIADLVKFHRSHGKLVTVTAVHPSARFGELSITADGNVSEFKEKPQTHDGWINGGFFVMEPSFLNTINGDDTILERSPLEAVASQGELMAYRHSGFWQCMDTIRDRNSLEELWSSGKAPWRVWTE